MNACEMFCHPCKSVLQMVEMLLEYEIYECVTTMPGCVTNLHKTHCRFVRIVHTRPAFNGNVNTNASESLQTSYEHYKCLANNKNGLPIGFKYVANMVSLRILGACF